MEIKKLFFSVCSLLLMNSVAFTMEKEIQEVNFTKLPKEIKLKGLLEIDAPNIRDAWKKISLTLTSNKENRELLKDATFKRQLYLGLINRYKQIYLMQLPKELVTIGKQLGFNVKNDVDVIRFALENGVNPNDGSLTQLIKMRKGSMSPEDFKIGWTIHPNVSDLIKLFLKHKATYSKEEKDSLQAFGFIK